MYESVEWIMSDGTVPISGTDLGDHNILLTLTFFTIIAILAITYFRNK
jgi:hypothetical protein